MSSTEKAIAALVAAKPDPAKVEALTKETLARREKPYTEEDAWGSQYFIGSGSNPTATCYLCRCEVKFRMPSNSNSNDAPELATHLAFHNNIESRLRRLEERGGE